jgi:hypothetical protein
MAKVFHLLSNRKKKTSRSAGFATQRQNTLCRIQHLPLLVITTLTQSGTSAVLACLTFKAIKKLSAFYGIILLDRRLSFSFLVGELRLKPINDYKTL